MKSILALGLAAAALGACATFLGGCATFDGGGLVPGQSTAADVERVMGTPAEKRQVTGGETWYYYPRQPFGRKTFVARVAPDGKLAAIEQRLTDENVARIVPNTTRAEQVQELLGPPWGAVHFAQLDRNIWTWHMRRFGDPGIPVQLNVQMSPDGVVREVVILDESDAHRFGGIALAPRGGVGLGIGIGF